MPRALPVALWLGALASLGPGSTRVDTAASAFVGGTSLGRTTSPQALPAPACGANRLPDDGVCVHLPDDDEGAPAAESAVNSHRDPRGDWVVYDQIPRRPDRPASYDAYQYPVPCIAGCVFSGYDLDRTDELQRRGHHLRHVGHGGVDITAPRGTPVALMSLDHQVENAEVIYVGPLFGTTVVTRHTLREGGVLRDYIVLFAHLESPGPRLLDHAIGTRLQPGEVIGFVGETGSPGLVHLHLEVRRVREGTDLSHLSPAGLVDSAATVVCDPRNVLAQK
jgi:murein DD-endopeptidase MepM/ murein hydrolase activator NlpD